MTRRFNVSIWDDEDLAVLRLCGALDDAARRQIEEIHRRDEAPAGSPPDAAPRPSGPGGRAEEVGGVSNLSLEPAAAPTTPDRRLRMAELVARVQAGDLAAIDEFRRLSDA